MKILVLSDSHGSVKKVTDSIDREGPKCIIFLGDCVRDFLAVCDNYSGVWLYIVSGNCDMGTNSGFSERIITDICGKRFYITHGHRENVKAGYMNLCVKALEEEADVALFGHTHMTCKNSYYGLELLNPGSISQGSYGVVEICEDTGKIKTSIKSIYDI